ncbi:MAG: carbon-nitrogen hydrolase family protein, partial [Firmicutes bacterium]|nr:carbon-nitrogen hydrolase family protein [Bacillota bacterium]
MRVGSNKEANITKARSMIKEASLRGSKMVILPEMFNCPYNNSAFPKFAESYPDGPTFRMLSGTAREEKIVLVGGSVPEKEGQEIFNSCFVFNPKGELIARHQKVHLFDVDLAGGLSFHESKTLGGGKQITVVQSDLCTFGVAICYDIRFPELSRLMALAGAQLLIIPAAFNMTTGPAHWEILLRVRAIDNQVYVAGAAPARDLNSSYVSYGNSAVIDPWGNIIARADERE